MSRFNDTNGVGWSAVPILHDHQASIDPRTQPEFECLGHSRGCLTGSDDDDAAYPFERVLVRTDRELVVTDPNLPADCLVGINGLQARPTQPGEDSFGSWLPDADLHHASYGSLSCLKQRLGHVCRGTLT